MSHESFQHLDHRPWPVPDAEWNWRQSWMDLAFIHYRVDAEAIAKLLPEKLTIQEFDGSAWVGVVPFRMSGVMRRPFPNMPGFSSFLELNVRTYVERDGKPGVWFFSLDTNSLPFVFGGRYVYGLPYHPAKQRLKTDNTWRHFTSNRVNADAGFEARYRPTGDLYFAEKGTFDHWATERYCLYSHSPRRGTERVDVHHAPWPLHRAEAEIKDMGLLQAVGISPIDSSPICHFSSGVHVVSYPIEKLISAAPPVI